jgi:hypothetical protein
LSPRFSFDINGSQITVDHAQIWVDAGFENSELILFYTKIGIPSSFVFANFTILLELHVKVPPKFGYGDCLLL